MKIIISRSNVFWFIFSLFCLLVTLTGILLLSNQTILKFALDYISGIKNISLETTIGGITKEQTWGLILMEHAKRFIAFGLLGLVFSLLTTRTGKEMANKLLSRWSFNRPHFSVGNILSISVLLFTFVFIFFNSYYRQPLGDDVLFQFTKGYLPYVDNQSGEIGEKVTNVRLLIESFVGMYNYHAGRIVGHTLIPLLSMFGQTFTAIVTGLSFAILILLVGAIIFGDFRESISHPLILLLMFLIFFYFNPSIPFLLMWTMTSIYVVSLILLCGYFLIFRNIFDYGRKKIGTIAVLLFNLLGFIAGLTHEVYSFAFLSLIGFLALKETIKSKFSLSRMFYHTGLLLGTFACITAPGNFIRLISSHDSLPMARPFWDKLIGVIKMNAMILMGDEYWSFLLLLGILVFTVFLHRKLKLDLFIKANALDVCFLLFLTFIWSPFPYIGKWGALLFVLWFTIVIFKNAFVYWIDKNENLLLRIENSYVGALLVFLVMFGVVIQNYNWMHSMAKTTIERNRLIKQAIKENRDSVKVPLYDEICTNRFTIVTSARENHNNFLNNNENESVYYKKYLRVRMYTRVL